MSDLRERARHMFAPEQLAEQLVERVAAEFAAIRAEGREEGWAEAMRWIEKTALKNADWLAANRPSPTDRGYDGGTIPRPKTKSLTTRHDFEQ